MFKSSLKLLKMGEFTPYFAVLENHSLLSCSALWGGFRVPQTLFPPYQSFYIICSLCGAGVAPTCHFPSLWDDLEPSTALSSASDPNLLASHTGGVLQESKTGQNWCDLPIPCSPHVAAGCLGERKPDSAISYAKVRSQWVMSMTFVGSKSSS